VHAVYMFACPFLFLHFLLTMDLIYEISYDCLSIMPKLPSTYDGRLIYQTSYEERRVLLFVRYDLLAKL